MIDAKSLLNGKNGISAELSERLQAGHVAVFSPLQPLELMCIADKQVEDFCERHMGNLVLPLNMSEIVVESLAKDCFARNIGTELGKLVIRIESLVYDKVDELVSDICIQRTIEIDPERHILVTANSNKWNIISSEYQAKVVDPNITDTALVNKSDSLLLDLNSISCEHWIKWLSTFNYASKGIVGILPKGDVSTYKQLLQLGVKLVEAGDINFAALAQCVQHRADVLNNLEDRKRRFIKTEFNPVVNFKDGVAVVEMNNPATHTAFDPNDFDVPFMRLHEPDVFFADVVGNDDLKAQLRLIKSQLKNNSMTPSNLPKGLLFSGPPGTGKTFMAEAFAGELGLSFIVINGADVVSQGCSVSNLKKLFEVIGKISPCVVFIDEADSLCRARSETNAQHSLAVNTLLALMDGVSPSNGSCIFIAATNHPGLLDPALLRAGRFEREVSFDFPREDERLKTIQLQSDEYSVGLQADECSALASLTKGQTHKAIQNIFRDTMLYSSMQGDIFDSLLLTFLASLQADEVIGLGKDEGGLLRVKAVHEAGHFLCIRAKNPHVRVKMVSAKYGVTVSDIDDELQTPTRKGLHTVLVTLLGGRAAEEVVFGEDMVTAGAFLDMKRATALAKRALTGLGGVENCEGVDVSQLRTYEGVLDKEVNMLVSNAYKEAKRLMQLHRASLEQVSGGLIKQNYLLETSLNKIAVCQYGEAANVANLH